MKLVSLGPDFGAEARGVGLIDVVSTDSAYRATRAALEEYSILLFRQRPRNPVHRATNDAAATIEVDDPHAMDGGHSLRGRHRRKLS
jgi:hypothetical protein